MIKRITKCQKTFCCWFYCFFSIILMASINNTYADHLNENTEYVVVNHSRGEVIGSLLAPVPGDGVTSSRVEYKLKLYKGKLDRSNKDVYFVITDASNKEFATRFGVNYSEILGQSSIDAVEDADFIDDGIDGEWLFFSDPGRVTRSVAGQIRPPSGNDAYSPLKKISFDPDGSGSGTPIQIIVNVPFIKWGNGLGQTLLIDTGGCDELIRKNPPSELFEGFGPPGCENDPVDDPLARYNGAQVTALDISDTGGTVTMKLHKGTFRMDQGHSVYYMVFESSKTFSAEFAGVIYAPKLRYLERGKKILGTVTQFGNGVAHSDGGPNRFQHGMISYPASGDFYTPMWHIRWIYWDLDQDGDGFADGIVLDNECNQSFSAILDPSVCGNSDIPDITYDPYQLRNNSGNTVKGVAFTPDDPILSDSRVLPDGSLPNLVSMFILMNRGELFLLTDSPGGLAFGGSNDPHIVNCPSPVSTLPVGAELAAAECKGNRSCPDGYTCVLDHAGPGFCYNFDL